MKKTYISKAFQSQSLALIDDATSIIEEYQSQGFSLSLRQLYYQLVARDLIPNTQESYKRVGSILVDARLAGLVDWEAIEDRTRTMRGNQHWTSPKAIMDAVVRSYKIDKWANQQSRAEVWIEKDALLGVISGACYDLDVDFFSGRGYASASSLWRAGQRMAGYLDAGQSPIIFHMSDHDPSGIDMTRDITERLELFAEYPIPVERIALNMDQIQAYSPPPNFAKVTDSRSPAYVEAYGHESWELDALPPSVLVDLITDAVYSVRDVDLWSEMVEREEADRDLLKAARAEVHRRMI